MRDAVFCLVASLRCRDRIDALLGILPEARREALRIEFERIAALSAEQAVARLSELSASAERHTREEMLKRWGPGFASEPRSVQTWLATRTAVTRR